MAATVGKSALLIGATGQTGQQILRDLLQSPDFAKVGEYGRRVTDKSALPASGIDKLVQRTIDFENLEEAGLKEHKWDVVFIALGTTKKVAGSAAAFEKIDREYVVNAARGAKSDAPDQRLVYVSVDASSKFLYTRSKGLTENALASLGYGDTIIFRPAFLAGTNRDSIRLGESIAALVLPIVSYFSNNAQIDISTLAKSVVAAGKLGSAALPASAMASQVGKNGASFTLINNKGALALASETK
ncbi:Oxidoreductase HTATIP2 [Termitomyces sp. J132]|nr:Oxidoreductase HTATIP2 [Termitomyces sp. J132]